MLNEALLQGETGGVLVFSLMIEERLEIEADLEATLPCFFARKDLSFCLALFKAASLSEAVDIVVVVCVVFVYIKRGEVEKAGFSLSLKRACVSLDVSFACGRECVERM